MIGTHIFDTVSRIICLILSSLLLLELPFLGHRGIGFLLLTLGLSYVLHRYIFRTLASFLYSRFILKMKITRRKASVLNDYLSPFFPYHSRWLPMKDVKLVPAEMRYGVALKIAKNWRNRNRKPLSEGVALFRMLKLKTPELTMAMYVLIACIFAISMLNLPPASFMREINHTLLDTYHSNRLVNFTILVIINGFLFKALESKLVK